MSHLRIIKSYMSMSDDEEDIIYCSDQRFINKPTRKMADLVEEPPVVATFAKWLHEFAMAGDLCQFANIFAQLRKANAKLAHRLVEHRDLADANRTPLLQAANIGKLGLVQLLVDKYGADLMVRDDRRESTALHLSAAGGHFNVTAYLVKESPRLLELKDVHRNTPLNLAAHNGRHKIVEFFATLEKKVWTKMLENRGRKGRTAFLSAVANGHLTVVNVLVKHGANVTAKDDENKTAFGLAASRGHLAVCQFLLEMGFVPNIDQQNDDGRTALHLAAKAGHLTVVAFLVRIGANLRRQTKDGHASMAIHLAAERGYLAIVRYLLQADPSLIEAKNGDGSTPINLACLAGHAELVEFLVVEHGAKIENRIATMTTMPFLRQLARSSPHGHQQVAQILASPPRKTANNVYAQGIMMTARRSASSSNNNPTFIKIQA